jgi:hypothetical protein
MSRRRLTLVCGVSFKVVAVAVDFSIIGEAALAEPPFYVIRLTSHSASVGFDPPENL